MVDKKTEIKALIKRHVSKPLYDLSLKGLTRNQLVVVRDALEFYGTTSADLVLVAVCQAIGDTNDRTLNETQGLTAIPDRILKAGRKVLSP